MARSNPLTWRNISNPRFDNSALGVASNAFSRAGQGFDIFSDAMRERTETEDQRLTNEAITEMLNGGSPTSNNRRVDATALFDANANKQGLESDLLTAATERRKTGLESDKLALDVEYAPDEHKALMSQRKESARASLLAGKLSRLEFDALEREIQREETGYQHLQEVATFEKGIQNDKYDKLYTEYGFGKDPFTGQGREPTEDEVNQMLREAEVWSQGESGHNQIEAFMDKIGVHPDYRAQTGYGQRETLARENEAAASDRYNQRMETQAGRDAQNAESMLSGNNELAVYSAASGITAGTEAQIKAQKIKNYRDGINRLSSVGKVNINKIDDKYDKETLQRGMEMFPNVSMFAGAASTYFDADGSFDRKGFEKALSKRGQGMVMRQINIDRARKQLPELTTDGTVATDNPPPPKVTGKDKGIAFDKRVNDFKTSLMDAQKEVEAIPADRRNQSLTRALERALGSSERDQEDLTRGNLGKREESLRILKHMLQQYEENSTLNAAQEETLNRFNSGR